MHQDDDTELVPDSIRAEAAKWRRLSGDLSGPRAALGRLELGPAAFFFPGAAPAAGHAALYEQFHDWFTRLLGDAAGEFAELGDALHRSAEEYTETDSRAAAGLRSIHLAPPEGNR